MKNQSLNTRRVEHVQVLRQAVRLLQSMYRRDRCVPFFQRQRQNNMLLAVPLFVERFDRLISQLLQRLIRFDLCPYDRRRAER